MRKITPRRLCARDAIVWKFHTALARKKHRRRRHRLVTLQLKRHSITRYTLGEGDRAKKKKRAFDFDISPLTSVTSPVINILLYARGFSSIMARNSAKEMHWAFSAHFSWWGPISRERWDISRWKQATTFLIKKILVSFRQKCLCIYRQALALAATPLWNYFTISLL